jgi:hypothetical protein
MLADNRIPQWPLSYLVVWLFWSTGLACEVTNSHFPGLQLVGASHDGHGLPAKISDQTSALIV